MTFISEHILKVATKTIFHVVSSWMGDNKSVYRVPQRIA